MYQPVTSISAWGSIPTFSAISKDREVLLKDNSYESITQFAHDWFDRYNEHVSVSCKMVHLNAAIAISVESDADTPHPRLAKVAVAFCNLDDRFEKKWAYRVLKKKLEADSALLWKGKFLLAKPIAEFISPATKAFKSCVVMDTTLWGSRKKGDIQYHHFLRSNADLVFAVRTMFITYLHGMEDGGVIEADKTFNTQERLFGDAEEEMKALSSTPELKKELADIVSRAKK